jgi:hypothetical protein
MKKLLCATVIEYREKVYLGEKWLICKFGQLCWIDKSELSSQI